MNTLKTLALGLALLTSTVSVHARVDKQDRVLVVVSELQEHGPQNLRNLYAIIENLTSDSTRLILGDDYRRIHFLKRSQATVANFKNLIQTLSKDNTIKAIDLIFSLHGSDEKVAFHEGSLSMSSLVSQMTAVSASMNAAQVATMKRKLRVVYNLSCFGRSHNDNFIAMGFDVSVGSRGINANSEVEYPSVLGAWQFGSQFSAAFALTNTDVTVAASDAPIRLVGIAADSKKFIRGQGSMNINSDPL